MNVLDTLHAALVAAVEAGCEVNGWTLTASGDGYAAWLYREEGDTDRSLFESVEVQPSAEDAAAWCLLQARALGEAS